MFEHTGLITCASLDAQPASTHHNGRIEMTMVFICKKRRLSTGVTGNRKHRYILEDAEWTGVAQGLQVQTMKCLQRGDIYEKGHISPYSTEVLIGIVLTGKTGGKLTTAGRFKSHIVPLGTPSVLRTLTPAARKPPLPVCSGKQERSCLNEMNETCSALGDTRQTGRSITG